MRHLDAALLILMLTACVSTDGPGPEDSLIIYGSLRMDSLLLDQPIERMLIIREEPDSPRVTVEPMVAGGMFFTEPLPVGGKWRIASITVAGEELVVSGLECRAEAPGLFFLGSVELAADPPRAVEVRRLETPDERENLQALLDAWRGTAWEALIRTRIRSLNRDTKS
ncbi:MAG TPA: hypothetical protein VMU36_10795 [Spirochaetia bacterium]|nr:hypothetical protein [Spirochaetia bacterium]